MPKASDTSSAGSNLDWMQRLVKVECPDSTYRPKKSPLVYSEGQGSIVTDADGKEYIDLCAGFGVLALGHNHLSFHETLREPNLLIHAMGDVYPSTDKIAMLETLSSIYPWGASKAALALSGSQAVEIALKTAMLATKRFGFICFQDAYHGLDLGVLPTTFRSDFRQPFESWLHTDAVVFVEFGADKKVLTQAVDTLKSRGHELAGVIAEPIQGRAGANLPPQNWLSELVAFAKSFGAVSILDDILAGIGRTGLMTNAQAAEFDLVCLGKSIGGGLPLSACIGKDSVMNHWPECHAEALHTGTFFGHPLACRIGRRTIQEIQSQKLDERSKRLGTKLISRLNSELANHKHIRQVRGQGLMVAIEFDADGAGAKLMDQLRDVGVIALASGAKGQSISFTPALNIPEMDLWDAIVRVENQIRAN